MNEPHPGGAVLAYAELVVIGALVVALIVLVLLLARRRVLEARTHTRTLQQSEERFRTLAETIPHIVWTAEPDGTLDFKNDRWLEYAGAKPGATGRGAASGRFLLHPDDRARTVLAWTDSIRNGTPYEIEHRLRRFDGVYRWHVSRAQPLRGTDGSIQKWFGSATDIDERKRNEQALLEWEQHYRFALRSANAASWEVDLTTGEAVWSEEHRDLYGLEPGTSRSTLEAWHEREHPEDAPNRESALRSVLEARGETFETENRIVHPERGVRWILTRGRVMYAANGTPLRMIGIDTDVTDRRRFEEAQRRLEIQGTLGAHLDTERRRLGQEMHDGIRQQLTGIQMLAKGLYRKLLASGDPNAEMLGEFARMVGDANGEVRRLIHGLVPVAIEGEHLVAALKRSARDVEQWYGVPCTVESVPEARVYDNEKAGHLYHIAQEAMTNAAKHSGAASIVVWIGRNGDDVRLAVRDDGGGLPVDFDQRGSLGIQSLRNRTELIGGRLSVESREGRGTTIVCSAADPAPQATYEPLPAAGSPGG